MVLNVQINTVGFNCDVEVTFFKNKIIDASLMQHTCIN